MLDAPDMTARYAVPRSAKQITGKILASPSTELIILLGNKNDKDGNLSPVAKDRCAMAAQLALEKPESKILPTGGFGRGFNTTVRPHGELLSAHLVELGVPPERIIPHVNSSHTIEDALFARKVVVDRCALDLVIVTSAYHADRAEFVFRRTFPDRTLTFCKTTLLPQDQSEVSEEDAKLRTLKAEWVDVPLYGIPGGSKDFPAAIYENASTEQKHYDNLSHLIITGMFIVFAYPHGLSRSIPAFLVSAVLIFGLFLMYMRAAVWARTARRVMQSVEAQYGQPGSSLNYPKMDHRDQWVDNLRPLFLSRQGRRGSPRDEARSDDERETWLLRKVFGVFARWNYPVLIAGAATAMVVVQLISIFVSGSSSPNVAPG
jgi:uncharacterized SAM-binding protein YcdF (DUF218 family)